MRLGLALICVIGIFGSGDVIAASKKAPLINWFDPEVTDAQKDKAQIRISGQTFPRALVSVDLGKIISITGGPEKRSSVSEIQSTRADEEGIFELEFTAPYGILQVPIQVQVNKEPLQSLLVIFEVGSNGAKINVKTIKRPVHKVVKEPPPDLVEEVKPRAERQRPRSDNSESNYDLSLGLGYPTHRYSQKINSESDVSFESGNAPSIDLFGGGRAGSMSFDIGFSSSSGGIAAAAAPFIIRKGDYNWQKLYLTGSYLFGEKPKRNGPGYEIILGYGTRKHPFLNINTVTKEVFAISITENDAILGFGAKFGSLTNWLYETKILYRNSLSATSETGEFKAKSASSFELDLVVKTNLSDSYLVSGYAKITANNNSFEYSDATAPTPIVGSNAMMVVDIGGSIGLEF